MSTKSLSPEQHQELIATLKTRFKKNANRHSTLDWDKIQLKLEEHPEKLWSLNEMEITGGEPDVIAYNSSTNEYTFCDCSTETPKGRRSLCYDQEALDSRKEHKPKNSAVVLAEEMGVKILNEEEYHQLQQLGKFDTKTSSWLTTPPEIRLMGGAIFGDWRFGRVFIYHNGAESYYGSRAFRALLKV